MAKAPMSRRTGTRTWPLLRGLLQTEHVMGVDSPLRLLRAVGTKTEWLAYPVPVDDAFDVRPCMPQSSTRRWFNISSLERDEQCIAGLGAVCGPCGRSVAPLVEHLY